ncbi:MAG: MBL fold metallo-hydrolase [Clostridia bacterium]|nr:MBL fold metallo-hydrolase [Clostridia bacterium]
MKITVLVDNNTRIDEYLLGEPAVSYYIEAEGKKILFDCGYSDVFIRNARKMGIDLLDIDAVVFSHGHNDHTWGISHLIQHYSGRKQQNDLKNRLEVIAHPLVMNRKIDLGEEIGINITAEKICESFDLQLQRSPFWISERLVFLGEIERTNSFENKIPIGRMITKNEETDDYVLDDSALVYKAKEGLVIITGCSHSGICNIVEYAKKVCSETRILDILGGLHLLNPDREQMKTTLDYIRKSGIRQIHACHCTDLQSKIQLSQVTEVKEVGVGLILEYE